MTTATEYTDNPVQAFYWDGVSVTTAPKPLSGVAREIWWPEQDGDGQFNWPDGSFVRQSRCFPGYWFAFNGTTRFGLNQIETKQSAARALYDLHCGPWHPRPAGTATREAIPLGVWWAGKEFIAFCREPYAWNTRNEYCDFHRKWYDRRAEFPQTREAAEQRAREAQRQAVAEKTVERLKDFTEALKSGDLSAYKATPPAEPVGGESEPERYRMRISDGIVVATPDEHGSMIHYASYLDLRDRLTARVAELERENEKLTSVVKGQAEFLKKNTDTMIASGQRIAELETQIAARGMSSEEYERRIVACAESLWPKSEEWLRGPGSAYEDALRTLRIEFPPSLFTPAAPPDTAWHEPGEVPQSPWVKIRLQNGIELAAIYQARGLFATSYGDSYLHTDITGWRYATTEPRGQRYEAKATPGPWYPSKFVGDISVNAEHDVICQMVSGNEIHDRDFIVKARTDLPRLLDALENAEREREAAVMAAVDRAWKIVENMTDNDYFNQEQVYALHKAAAEIRKGGAE